LSTLIISTIIKPSDAARRTPYVADVAPLAHSQSEAVSSLGRADWQAKDEARLSLCRRIICGLRWNGWSGVEVTPRVTPEVFEEIRGAA